MTAYDDFRFASADHLADLGGPVSRFNQNVAAIKLLKSLEAEGRAHGDLTPDEQRTLTRYSGWGDNEALSRLFPYSAHLGLPIHPELDGILTDDEREFFAIRRDGRSSARGTSSAPCRIFWKRRPSAVELQTARRLAPH